MICFLFQILWGVNYTNPKYPFKSNPHQITENELKKYANQYLKRSKDLRSSFNQDIPFYLTVKDSLLIQAYKSDSIPNPAVKKSLFSSVLNYFGVLGYYNPFTGEAQYNDQVPPTKIPFTFGHEMAHQKSIARENEANFDSFLVGIKSKNKEVLYSTNYKALRSLLKAIYPTDSTFVKTVIENYSVGMKKDREIEQEYYQKYDLFTRSLFRNANDAFLKANRQKGVQSYSDFVQHLVDYERNKN